MIKKNTSKETLIPARKDVAQENCWDLSRLFSSNSAWESAFAEFEGKIGQFSQFEGKLGESAAALKACLDFDLETTRLAERLGSFAFLKTAEDAGEGTYQDMIARFRSVASRASQAASFIRPEIMSLDEERIRAFLRDEVLAPYRLQLERWLRYRPHTLSQKEESLLAMQSEMAATPNNVFRQLNDVDLKFGKVTNEKGRRIELSHGTFSSLLQSTDRRVRKSAFKKYYEQFAAHAHTIAASLAGSIHGDVYYARARNFPGALEAALFPDNVPESVYLSLIEAVRSHLPAVHRYYKLRQKTMGIRDIHHYDTYVPILSSQKVRHSWDQAVEVVLDSLRPLGHDYQRALSQGLKGRWCDRYENRGKQSGAFSAGTYDGEPYILMNYQADVLDHVFTLTHEAGHSMHSYYSVKRQPFQYYDYSIFVAEVASTFNEQLLSRHLMDRAKNDRQRAFLINKEIDSIRGTIIRQTMFAEFELKTHRLAERGEALTLDAFKNVYAELLNAYFGPDFTIDPELHLECLRIPHFYRAFYVYKYATGLAAAIALSQRVVEGGQSELDDYLNFLHGGCSQDPLDLLKGAGVDMTSPIPVETALARFEFLVEELERLL